MKKTTKELAKASVSTKLASQRGNTAHHKGHDMSKDNGNKKNGTAPRIPKPEQILYVPLSDIFVNYEWNGRAASRVNDPGGDEDGGTGIVGLKDSMVAGGQTGLGQDTPVDLRETPKEWHDEIDGAEAPYTAITGFRRITAIRLATEEFAKAQSELPEKERTEGLPCQRGLVRCVLHSGISEFDAQDLNAAENLSREGLAPADVAYTVWRMAEHRGDASDKEIGKRLGLSQGYVSELLRIKNGNAEKGWPGVRADLRAAWRNPTQGEGSLNPGGLMLTISEMSELAKLPLDQQEAAFRTMLVPKKRGGPGRGNWIEAGKKEAEHIGAVLGSLAREGHIIGDEIEWDSALHLIMNKLHKDCSAKAEDGGLSSDAKAKRAILCNAANAAYVAAATRKTDDEVRAEQAAADAQKAALAAQTAPPAATASAPAN